ncbi:hypothetical protein HYH02_004883 [Chlamydomonas schloesseri]|uniref:BZIP domain-containing protein n=1 Tax=Chlamydomonas schloesseri TaxID=2026947 RepID=A0A835WNA4_9CHLO|nr:hypothetical protein HYH02_004883 [Chlamydomonas schloesseri]|eukprot:KAG2450379.1 hypothetical protein HYH02_004883 [Chlamydomonas schloesseri]
MKSDVTGSPSEAVGPRYAEGNSIDHELLSDDEPETELEALQHLPPEERRKALRRLRNRESARRVRARRLAEMSQMETTVQGMQDENTALKEHVAKLQGHIQQMTMRQFEITAKYEAAVAENAQLRVELQRSRRDSIPGETGYTAPSASMLAAQPPLLPSALLAAAASQGPNSAPHLCQPTPQHAQPQVQPLEKGSMQLGGDGAGAAAANNGNTAATAPGCLSSLALGSHAQLRTSNAMDLVQQRAALDEVVMLLHEHKHRRGNQGPDRSACSEIGSSAVGNNAAGAVHAAPHANSFSTGVNNNRSTGAQLHIRTSSIMNDGSAAVGSGSGGIATLPPNATSPALGMAGAGAAGLMPAYGSGLVANTPNINNAGGPGPVPLSFLTASGSGASGAAGFGAAGAGAGLGGHRASSPMDMITAGSVAAASAGIVAAGGLGDGSGGRPTRSEGMVSMLQMTPQQVNQQHQLMAQMHQQQQSQLQQQMAAAQANTNGSSGLSHLGTSYSMDAAFMTPQQQQHLQQHQQRLQQQAAVAQQQVAAQGPSSAFDLSTGLSQMQMQQQQQQQQVMQSGSHSQPLLKMQLAHHQQFSLAGQQQNMVLDGSGHQQHLTGQSQPLLQLYQQHNTAPDFVRMSAQPFRPSEAPGGYDGASAPLPTIPSSGTMASNGQLSCLERGVLGGDSMYLGGTGGTGTGMAGTQQVTFHSASFAIERRTGLPPPHPQQQGQGQGQGQQHFSSLASGLRGGAGGMNLCFQPGQPGAPHQEQEQAAMMQQHGLGAEGWHLNAMAAGVAALKPEDISEDMMMTLDELSPFVPQDL